MPKKEKAEKKGKVDDDNRQEKENWDLSDIHLKGEDEEKVPVYDTCDDIRPEISAHLRHAPTTRARFLREPSKSVQSTQLQDFLGDTGARSSAIVLWRVCVF